MKGSKRELKNSMKKTSRIPCKMVLAGFALAGLWWGMEAIVTVSVFHEGSLVGQILLPNWHEAWMRLSTACLLAGFGVYAQITLSRRKRMESEARQRYDEERALRQKLETEISKRVEFTRTLTHELKTPLTSVLASSDLLASEVKDPSLQSLASSISRSAANLNSRVDELLDLARAEIGMLELNLEEVEVSQLLREAAESMTPLASKREHSLAVDVPAVLPIVQADPVRLQQVVGNLLSNAIKYTPKGGKITLRGSHEGTSVVVEVEDTGRGLSKEEQDRVFDPYHRLEEDRQRMSGLGLGLGLCRSLVELHGGKIWVRSAVGKGSTFCFSLPLDT